MDGQRGRTKKYISYIFASIAMLAFIILICVYGFKGEQTKELFVVADDITLSQGESKALEYKVSVSKATVLFQMLDKSIATIEDNFVVGVTAGTTQLVITAKYEDLIFERKVSVTVADNGNDSEDDGKDDSQQQNPTESEKPSEGEDLTLEVVQDSLEIDIYSSYNCDFNGKTVEVAVNKQAFLFFSTEETSALEIECDSESLDISLLDDFQRTIKLKATECGEYDFKLKLGDKVATFKVVAV